ncbi:MAG: lipopolysaccharide heptosyltransferase II [Alphaproteobacteria bacterium]|nr:MAG: lipopolysaccharide heptosyltransferase II [Alphaproteobacteria bacterium]
MNMISPTQVDAEARPQGGSLDRRPILIVPYMWIGDFVRCHTVVKLLKARFPARPVDVLSTTLCTPLADYMPELRQAIVVDLPRKRLSFAEHKALAARLEREGYGTALVMPRTWKAALAPFLAGIPERIGWLGEWRFGLVNDLRFGERKLPRMVDQCAALALPAHATLPDTWPLPELRVPAAEVAGWRERIGLAEAGRPIVALAPGAVGPSKRWPGAAYGELARRLLAQGNGVWVVGGPAEASLVRIIRDGAPEVRDLTGTDLRNAILALAAADVAVSNDSGLLHVAAAIGTPTIGIFGPTSPWHWAPLNPIAAAVQQDIETLPCQPCHKPTCRMRHHRCMRDISPEHVLEVTQRALLRAGAA